MPDAGYILPGSNTGINIFRVAEGKIAEIWDIADRLWLWQQLGVLPDIKEAIIKARDSMIAHQSGQDNIKS
jgi:hypothetical protein